MGFIEAIIIIAVIGIAVWAAKQYLPIDATFMGIIMFVAVILCLFVLLAALKVVPSPIG